MKDISDLAKQLRCFLTFHFWEGAGNPSSHGMWGTGYLKRRCKVCGKESNKPIIT